MTTTHPAVVIGGGIVGICCALYLQREGLEVTLVEPARGATTGRLVADLLHGRKSPLDIRPFSASRFKLMGH
ncbi:FAD-dependent oxidoreductase [Halomonas alkaliantarctica]|uniref:FAD-dependent oxidoreductase n=1 Tax=Halomonas alkaliantarctica TaxID=232346 RepID=UPI0018DD4B49|nr:FAD-dependent oxidoreductase [Halomonas alkaliantarctica]